MESRFDPGALLGRSYPLDDGARVHLRVARPSDVAPIRGLFAREDDTKASAGADLEIARLVNFDPRERCVLTATALIDGGERMVGVGSIRLDQDEPSPEAVIVDPEAPAGLQPLLAGALIGRAATLAHSRAA